MYIGVNNRAFARNLTRRECIEYAKINSGNTYMNFCSSSIYLIASIVRENMKLHEDS